MLKRLFRSNPKKKVVPQGFIKGYNVLDEYVREMPSHQLAVNLFKGEWSCAFPGRFGISSGGHVPAFEDPRIEWASSQLGGFAGKRVLELGPLEAAHTYMLQHGGASCVHSIESNKRAYVKCLIAKEVTGMRNVQFMLGDFNEYMKQTRERYDVVFASGVLYHMLNPAETIQLASQVADAIFIWSHYYDEELIARLPEIKRTMGKAHRAEQGGYSHQLFEHFYDEFLSVPAFCGGSNPKSYWMTRDGMLGCLEHFGFRQLSIGLDQKDHPGGPAMCIVGRKP